MRSRIVLLLIALTVFWSLIVGRAAYLQLLPNERLKALQKRQFETTVTLNARRGDVIDRNGNELAVSMTTYSLFADPKILEEPKKVARMLSKELKLPLKQVEDKLKGRQRRFVWIQRRLGKEMRDHLAEMKIRGLGFVEETERIYPNDRLLSHVLGFVGGDSQGLEGLELRYNEHLQAARKKVSLRRDARGRPLIVNGQVFSQAPDGSDIQLTIDRELQFVLEQELSQAVREHEADSAVGVVLDAQTSEILAMASAPSFDPNRAADFPHDRKRNRAITDSFEPGSTMKTFVIAGALSQGILEPNTKWDVEGGRYKIGNRVIRESDSKNKWSHLTTAQILAYSSNIGTTKVAFKMGQEKVLETLKAFGFGEKTGVDLPGEARGIMHGLPWKDHLMANISFGHGMTATALQVANAYAVIANGGYLKQPFVVKTIRDHETGEVLDIKPKTIRRVLVDDHVAKMRIMLAGTTTGEGTGLNARVAGYPVAGKTGTAQKVNPNGRGYLPGGYISSFGGFLPANDPRFVIYVAVDHPRKGYYGSAVAAPVFSRVARFAVRRSGLAPVLISQENMIPSAKKSAHLDHPASETGASGTLSRPIGSVVPDLAGLTLREVLGRVTGTGIKVKVTGQGFVTHTLPAAGTELAEARELTVFLSH
jgi:cell division protein FtsI (penicillin-binding protein 3)